MFQVSSFEFPVSSFEFLIFDFRFGGDGGSGLNTMRRRQGTKERGGGDAGVFNTEDAESTEITEATGGPQILQIIRPWRHLKTEPRT